MLGLYDPKTVYSSIDGRGRYAFGNQPEILNWNMARLAECLLPLIDSNTDNAIEALEACLKTFQERFRKSYMEMLGRKLGLESLKPEDDAFIVTLLDRMEEKDLDYTLTFDLITRSLNSADAACSLKGDLGLCFDFWQKRIREEGRDPREVLSLMRRHNPVVIPRNHHMEAVIRECYETGRGSSAEAFLKALRSPYVEIKETCRYQDPPADGDRGYRTFCGT